MDTHLFVAGLGQADDGSHGPPAPIDPQGTIDEAPDLGRLSTEYRSSPVCSRNVTFGRSPHSGYLH